MSLFDHVVVVDWSARNRPATGADSIWIAHLDAAGNTELTNPPTRLAAERALSSLIDAVPDQRVLIGVDASLGYPAGTSSLFGCAGRPWAAMWTTLAGLVTDDDRNRNNRFDVAAALNRRAGREPGPFWGAPLSQRSAWLKATKPPRFPVGEYRLTEQRCRDAGCRPASVWQLLGAGSVGGQTLTAVPVFERLRQRRSDRVVIWPFTEPDPTRFVPNAVVVTEIWPTLFSQRLQTHEIRDAAQVMATADALTAADAAGELRAWFDLDRVDPGVSDVARRQVIDEEGWMLGPPAVQAMPLSS